jgi:hypothetical protein
MVGPMISKINDTEIHSVKDIKAFGDKNKNTKSFMFVIVKDGFLFYRGIDNN